MTVLLGLLEIKKIFVLPLIYMKCWNILNLVGLPSEISGVQSCPIIPLKQEPKISTQSPLNLNLLKANSFNMSDHMTSS